MPRLLLQHVQRMMRSKDGGEKEKSNGNGEGGAQVTTHALRDRRWRAFAEPVGADENPEYHALVRAPLERAQCGCRRARPARARARRLPGLGMP